MHSGGMTDALEITPCSGPVRGSIQPPGSKSIANRALVVAALADGTSLLTGVPDGVDTRVMMSGLRQLGYDVVHDADAATAGVSGRSGKIPASDARLNLQNAGTATRFLTAMCCLGHGRYTVDGNARMRERPIRDLTEALEQLGAGVQCSPTGCPPVEIEANGLDGGSVKVLGRSSSQFLSALLMAAPYARQAVEFVIPSDLVSRPYIDITLGVMSAFGVVPDRVEHDRTVVHNGCYQSRDYAIEPDASAAGYFFAAAAVTRGKVTVTGLSRQSLQGDVAFVDALEQMGCIVTSESDSITVEGRPLRGIDIDMNAISDTAQTLAAVAVFADGETTIRNIAHVRHKETDRIHAVVTELRKLGLHADEHEDGMTIHPGTLRPTTVRTWDDHRMAMSFALIGLRCPGTVIADPECTSKTYPGFFADLSRLCGTAG